MKLSEFIIIVGSSEIPACEVAVLASTEGEAVQQLQILIDSFDSPLLILGVKGSRPAATA